jgi:imidazole glycerol-phosphate synthase subunit HisH
MGWNRAEILRPVPLLEGIADGSFFYFVHSYYVRPADPDCIVISTTYDHPFCAMVARNSLFATQFHPEKSQVDGLRLLKNFAQFSPRPEPHGVPI